MIRNDLNEISKQYEGAFAKIKQGEWYKGLSLLEYRNISDFTYPLQGVKTALSKLPWWTPGQSIKGRTVIICAEQGRGDVINFSRFIPLIKQANEDRKVFLYYYKDLHGLMRRLGGIDGFVDEHSAPEGALKVKTMSLYVLLAEHGILPKELKSPFYGSKGIFKNPDLVVPKRDKPLVGICWKSTNDSWNVKAKVIPDEVVKPFLDNQSIDFVSLHLEQSFMPQYLESNQWTETADKIQVLDAVISVDTAVAHMAGSVGTPVYNLIGDKEYAGWIWYPNDKGKTYWYDSMRTIWWDGYQNWDIGLQQAIDLLEVKKKPTRKK